MEADTWKRVQLLRNANKENKYISLRIMYTNLYPCITQNEFSLQKEII